MPDYIGTREAAKLVGVSEASIRRWSDSGLIASHRVGRRGERRFERAAVLALRSARTTGLSDLPPAPVLLEGSAIPLHTHISSYYTSNRGRRRLGIPFLRDGVLAGQHCIVYANLETAAEIEAELAGEDINLSRVKEGGRWLHLEPFTDVEMGLATLEEAFASITRRGGVAIRLLGEGMQSRDGLGSLTNLLRFEDSLHSLVRRYPVVVLCQYDARLLEGAEVIAILKAHADNFDRSMRIYLN